MYSPNYKSHKIFYQLQLVFVGAENILVRLYKRNIGYIFSLGMCYHENPQVDVALQYRNIINLKFVKIHESSI